ncbi:uncharacterized protein LOC106178266 [Lingula anatina]|uniref:Uncharacterized protein LOC106178266 n=1 Tax=Lingula anatina TaxID=7574 RepID=A0A1S3K347_LINAN|nr:uncharacterized protein LOC106178266 [Lingula anatina]|eukprot:XP_013416839.1 uncharacterized protein LOC106178266 [Lingula anatina]
MTTIMAAQGAPADKKQDQAAEKPKEAEEEEEIYVPKLTPEEQDLAYELKAVMMRNIAVQQQKVKTELALHGKMDEMKKMNWRNQRLKHECELSRTNAIKLMKMFERKAKEADVKVQSMEKELQKAQEVAKKYQELYDQERTTKGVGARPPSRAAGADIDRPPSPMKIKDIIRRNEVLEAENDKLKREVHRLKQDNGELIKKVKGAQTHAINVTNALGTSEAARAELIKRLDKEKKEHDRLSRSLTKQASDWIYSRKQMQMMDEGTKWNQVGHVDVLGGEDRLYRHPVQKNVYTPKKMLPVQQWASANQSS